MSGNLFGDQSVILVDGKNFLFRNFYPHAQLATKAGEPTGALFGVLNGLLSLAHKFPDAPIVFVWDGMGDTWRHKLMRPQLGQIGEAVKRRAKKAPISTWLESRLKSSVTMLQGSGEKKQEKNEGYKANRNMYATDASKNMKKIALDQLDELMGILKTLGVPQFRVEELEGDDLIGILATHLLNEKLFSDVIVHSNDRDFYQLIPKGVRILTSKEGVLNFVREENIMKEFGVATIEWVKYRAIVGDDSDNIPNVLPGIGPVRGLKLLRCGIDASKREAGEVSEDAIFKLMDFCKDGSSVAEVWKRLRLNYLASHIVCNPQFYLFSPKVSADVTALVRGLKRESCYRHARGKTEDAYREFGEWLVQKEMDSLRTRKDEFCQLL